MLSTAGEKEVGTQRKTHRETAAHWGDLEGQGSRVLERHGWPETTSQGGSQRDCLCLPCPSLFLVIKFEIGALEGGSMEHGGEGREAAQWKHKVQWVWMRKGRHSAVRTATALQ